MAVFRSLSLLALSFLWIFTREVTESCVFMKSCILPCSFVPGEDVVIHWVQLPKDIPVHSYYHSKDQLTYQDSQFKGRTSLFQDQISKGNASLLLSSVHIQDEAKYKCYISTIGGSKESFNELSVEAPVNQIHLEQDGNEMSCSSEGIYPEPGLIWSSDPPFAMVFKNKTTVQQTEELLYSISSSLVRSDTDADVDFSCTISTSRHRRTATLFKQNSISGSNTQTIPCASTTTSTDKTSIIWRFNHSQVIVDPSGAVSEQWKPHVKEVTDSGSLVLQLSSSNQDGIYTCELNDAEKTLIINTFLEYRHASSNVTVAIVVGVLFVALCLIGGILLYCRCKNKKQQSHKATDRSEAAGGENGTKKLLTINDKNGIRVSFMKKPCQTTTERL